MLRHLLQSAGRPGQRLRTMGLVSSRFTSTSANPESDLIEKLIRENCVVIFSKSTCSFCNMAKGVFQQMETPYHALELNRVQGGDRISQALMQLTGSPTVPQVFVNGQCIGGGTETRTLFNQGKLAELVAGCCAEQSGQSS